GTDRTVRPRRRVPPPRLRAARGARRTPPLLHPGPGHRPRPPRDRGPADRRRRDRGARQVHGDAARREYGRGGLRGLLHPHRGGVVRAAHHLLLQPSGVMDMDTTSTGTTGLAWQRDPLPEARRATAAGIAARGRKPVFGTVMTEHIVTVDWTAEDGWHDARLRPYGPLEMDPAMVGLQYGQVVFEGFKAFRHADGAVTVFRPTDHAHRFRNSARRLALPEMPVELFLDAVRELVAADERWVPAAPGQSLYLRPVLYATTPSLAVAPGDRCRFLLLAFVTETFFGAD